jgi:hypothetical protein
MPVTNPLVELTVAMVVLLLVQVPPPAVLLSVVVCVWHTAPVPVIAAGPLFTVTTFVL